MKIVREEIAKKSQYASTSSVLDYSMDLNEKSLDFCINTITGRYPETGYCSNLECDELCFVLEGKGIIYKKEEDIIHLKRMMLFSFVEKIFIIGKGILNWRLFVRLLGVENNVSYIMIDDRKKEQII